MSEVIGQKPLTPPVMDHKDIQIIQLEQQVKALETQLDIDVLLSVSRYKRIQRLEAAIRENPCLTLVAQEVPFKDCFPAEPCEPCHCGKSLLTTSDGDRHGHE